jgi:hypothetical protein
VIRAGFGMVQRCAALFKRISLIQMQIIYSLEDSHANDRLRF